MRRMVRVALALPLMLVSGVWSILSAPGLPPVSDIELVQPPGEEPTAQPAADPAAARRIGPHPIATRVLHRPASRSRTS